MSEDNKPQDELATLKARADQLGLQYHPSIGVEKLREKVAAAIAGTPPAPDAEPAIKPNDAPAAPTVTISAPVPETANEKRGRLKREATKLIRIRVTCMNPAKKEWEGEIFTAGNTAVGSVKKYVPFNAEDGWHVPNIILQLMQDRMCQVFTTVVDSRGNKVRKGKQIREFAIEVMPALTEDELSDLALRQAASKSID